MTATTLSPLAASAEEARIALEPARRIYTRFGYSAALEADAIELLISAPADEDAQEETVEELRNFFWNYFAGGTTAAKVTKDVLTNLGRGELANPNWI